MIIAEETPAHNCPVPGGPSSADILAVFIHLARSEHVAAVSMSAWNPDLDENDQTEAVCMACFRALLD